MVFMNCFNFMKLKLFKMVKSSWTRSMIKDEVVNQVTVWTWKERSP